MFVDQMSRAQITDLWFATDQRVERTLGFRVQGLGLLEGHVLFVNKLEGRR